MGGVAVVYVYDEKSYSHACPLFSRPHNSQLTFERQCCFYNNLTCNMGSNIAAITNLWPGPHLGSLIRIRPTGYLT